MLPDKIKNILGRDRIDDRQIAELIGIAHGIISDAQVGQKEIEYFRNWLDVREHITGHPLIAVLKDRFEKALADGVLDKDESDDLLITLFDFAGGDFERGELTKSSSLPICQPPPAPMKFRNAAICFTGTFAFGIRRTCEAAVTSLGALPGSLTERTRYLVIGAYATESWSQSAFGRKIEKAAEMRAKGLPVSIVGEKHWVEEMVSAGYRVS